MLLVQLHAQKEDNGLVIDDKMGNTTEMWLAWLKGPKLRSARRHRHLLHR
jgi:hypothetical protein